VKYGSVCSGIEAATAAWHGLGWQPSFFSEIEAFPRAVLAHHYPDVPLHGDFTTIEADQYEPIDLLVGGTPCQSFSIAGLRGGLDDDRGNLALEFLRLADRTRARWVVWENVPGVLSSNGGRDFGSILGGLGELGYGWAYRVLDAQFFGVAQRRRRVFVVGHLGDWRRAAAVLFERHSLSGHPAPRRETGPSVAALTATGVGTCGADDNQGQAGHLVPWPAQIAPTLNAAFGSKQGLEDQHIGGGQGYLSLAQCLTTGTGQRYDAETETLIPTHGGGFDVMAFDWQSGGDSRGLDPKPTAQLQRSQVPAVAFGETARTLSARHDGSPCADRGPDVIAVQSAVRRLTPRECERLQGFPDDFTAIPYRNKPADQCPDGPRYKALGNSMAVPVMRWIGERIAAMEAFNAS
jgi:DNA (cytosine-5)-methyltransferase 1